MRDRSHVADRGDNEANGLQRAQRRLAARTGARNFHFQRAHAVIDSLATGIFGGPFPRVRYWGFDRARLGVTAPTGGGENVFTFARRGLFDWRLVGVKLPDEVPAPSARAPAP